MLPQINKGQGMPASEMYELFVQGAARELLRDVSGAQGGCSVLQVQTPSGGTVTTPLGGNRAMELVGSSSERQWARGDQSFGVVVVCPGQREHSSVLALAVGAWGL